MKRIVVSLLTACGLMLTSLVAGATSAELAADSSTPFLRACACRAVDDLALARLRGGFDDGRGLVASIGVERLTVVNGTLVSTVNLQISDLSKVTPQQAQQLQNTLTTLGLVNGAGNLNPSLQGGPAGTAVIQNTLSNQTIRNATVLSVGTNSQQFVRATNLQNTLQDALNQPLSGH